MIKFALLTIVLAMATGVARAQDVVATGDFDGDGKMDRVLLIETPLKMKRLGVVLASDPGSEKELVEAPMIKFPMRGLLQEGHLAPESVTRGAPGAYRVSTVDGERIFQAKNDVILIRDRGTTIIKYYKDGRFPGRSVFLPD